MAQKWTTNALRQVTRRLGYDLVPYDEKNDKDLWREKIFRDLKIDTVLDVGANAGQYASTLRKHRYAGKIISFEPLGGPFETLKTRAAKDKAWECRRLALGDRDDWAELHVANLDQCSSILRANQTFLDRTPLAASQRSEKVQVARLDTLEPELLKGKGSIFLKIDVQGYESEVLRGAAKTLPRIAAVELEMSLVPLYHEQAGLSKILDQLNDAGFVPIHLSPVTSNKKTGHMLQVDGVFVRRAGTA